MIKFTEKLFYSRFRNSKDNSEIPYNYKSEFISEDDKQARSKYGNNYLKEAKEVYDKEIDSANQDYYWNSPGLVKPEKKRDQEAWARKHEKAKEKLDIEVKAAKDKYDAALAEKGDFDRQYEEKYGKIIQAERDLAVNGYKYRVNSGLADSLAEKYGNLDLEDKKEILLARKDLLDKYNKKDADVLAKRKFEDNEVRPNKWKTGGRVVSDTATGMKRQWEDAGIVYNVSTDGRSLNKDAAMIGAGVAAVGLGSIALKKRLKKKRKEKELANSKFKTSSKK